MVVSGSIASLTIKRNSRTRRDLLKWRVLTLVSVFWNKEDGRSIRTDFIRLPSLVISIVHH
jgi:hypothetical protein